MPLAERAAQLSIVIAWLRREVGIVPVFGVSVRGDFVPPRAVLVTFNAVRHAVPPYSVYSVRPC